MGASRSQTPKAMLKDAAKGENPDPLLISIALQETKSETKGTTKAVSEFRKGDINT